MRIKLTDILNEITVNNPKDYLKEKSFNKFLELVATDIYTAGMDDPSIKDITDWDSLFYDWENYGLLDTHTQSDIIKIAKEARVLQDDLDYILNLPQVSSLERG